jgi:hypothetical protein
MPAFAGMTMRGGHDDDAGVTMTGGHDDDAGVTMTGGHDDEAGVTLPRSERTPAFAGMTVGD